MPKHVMFNATTGETRVVERVVPLVDDWYYVADAFDELYDLKDNLIGYVREWHREGNVFYQAILL